MKCRITVLCDNTVGPIAGTLGEHGFAALIEWGGGSILFDTGGGETLLHNALRMNRDLRRLTAVALSHGHYDHTGGLSHLLRLTGRKTVYAHPGLFTPRYRVKDTGEAISIGIPFSEEYLRGLGADFSMSREAREIAPGLFLTGEVRHGNAFETGDSGLYTDPAGVQHDQLADDQSLAIVGEKGLILLLGCCHAGLINTIAAAQELTGISEIRAVIGGTHLGFCSAGQLDLTVAALRELGIDRIYGSHCTGFVASARLHREFPGQFQPAQVGTTIET